MGWLKELGKAAARAAEKSLGKAGIKVAGHSAENAEKSVAKALANGAKGKWSYVPKANYAEWIESMGGNVKKMDFGFKSWEKILPKSMTGSKAAEHIGENVAKRAERVVVEGTKVTGKGANHTPVKTGEVVAEETSKKAASKSASKAAYTEGGKIINKTAGWAGQYARYTAKHPVASFILSSVAYHQLSGRTLLPDLMKSIGGEEAAQKGLVGVLGESTLGKKTDRQGNEVGMVGNLTDILFGEGSYGKFKYQMGAIEGEAVGLYRGVKGGVSSVVGEGADLYESGKDRIGQYFSGNGMVSNGTGGYYDPTTPQYPSTSQMIGESNPQGMPQQGGVAGTMVNGVNTLANELTGGNVSKMNLASLALSSYMMFGPFGWLGKMGSLMLGGMTMRNINHRQAESQPMQQMPRYAAAMTAEQPRPQIEMPTTEEPVIRRSRGL